MYALPCRSLVLLTLAAAAAFAQTTASLNGAIVDSSGAAVPGARVALANTDTNLRRDTVTDGEGLYTFPLLPPGSYSLTVQKDGFKQISREAFRLEVNQAARVDLTMQVGAVSETVEVTGAAPLLNSTTSSVGHVIDQKAVADLPLNGRNFVQLAILGPGVVGVGFSASGTIGSGSRPDDMRPGTELFSNGNREQSNNFLLDGADNNFRRNGLITLRPSVESVREFKIQTNLFGAEQGRNPGATVNVITKSGSNKFRGSAYEFFRSEKLDGREYFTPPSVKKPPYRQNQFGASLGGPIVRDKLFFFADYEGYRRRRGINTSVNTVPTAATRNGDFSAVRDIFDPVTVRAQAGAASGYVRDPFPGRQIPRTRMDSVTSRLVQAYPLPDIAGLTNNQFTNPMNLQNWDQGDVRLDYTVTSNTTAFGRFSRQDTLTQPPSTFGPRQVAGLDIPVGLGNDGTFAGDSYLKAYHAVAGVTHVFSPTLIFDFRMGYGRFNLRHLKDGAAPDVNLGERLGVPRSNQGPVSWGIPIFAPANYTGIGGASSLPTIRLENTFNPNVSVTKLMGPHTLKLGTNIVRRQIIDFQTNRGDGRFNFDRTFTSDPNNTGATGDTMASFLLGAASAIEQDFLLVWAGMRTMEGGSYFQDDWKVTSKLTLNLGIRYEYTPPPVEVADRWANFNAATGKMVIAGVNGNRRAGVSNDGNNWAPRFGFAYKARRSTVIRGGAGIFYNTQGNGSAVFRLHRHLPFGPINVATIDQFNPNVRRVAQGFDPIPAIDIAQLTTNPVGSFNSVPENYKTGYAQQMNLGIEHEVGSIGTVFKAAYVGNLARQVDSVFDINRADPGPGTPQSRRPLRNIAPGVVGASYADTSGRANYHSLQMTAEKRFTASLGFLTAYTWSHSIDNVPLQQGGGSDGPVPQDIRYRFLDRGTSGFDITHRFTESMNWAVPVGKGKRMAIDNAWANHLLGGWQMNGIVTIQTGLSFTPTLATAVSNSGGSKPDRRGAGTLDSGRTIDRWFDTSFNTAGAAWFTPAQFTYGNGGRNILRGPGRWNLDYSLFKNFAVTERVGVQFRSEFFNIFNHPQFDLPNPTIGNPNAGRISATVGTPRDIQFSLRLSF